MKHRVPVLGILALAASCNAVPSASVTPRYGPLGLDGDIAVSASVASVRSSADALGADEDDDGLAPRADADWGPFDAWVSLYNGDFGGRGVAEGQLDLGGVIITAGDVVDSELELSFVDGGIVWDLIPGETVDLGIGLGAASIDFDANIRSVTTGLEVGASESFTVPVLAARGAIAAGDFEISVVATGFGIDTGIDDVTFMDADAMAAWRFLGGDTVSGGLVIGYRYAMVEADFGSFGSDVEADLELSGPYLGLTLQL